MYRPNISDDLGEEVRRRIVNGLLPPGSHVNEVHLAESLSVSRTPLREALSQLSAEGLIVCKPRRGFFTTKLTRDEVEQLYPVRALLDPQALRLAGVPDNARINQLRRINQQLARAGIRPDRAVELDDQWHRLLLSNCPNPILLRLIDQMIWRTRRYEFAYLSESNNVALATDEHDAIIGALENDELAVACRLLKQNMVSAAEPLIAWLGSRDADNDK